MWGEMRPCCSAFFGCELRAQKAREHLRATAAGNRTVLAAERTYAAWVRTGLMSLAAGVGVKKTLGGVLPEWVVVLTGSVLVAFAAFCFTAAVWRELYPGTPPPRPDARRLPRALLFALNGFLTTAEGGGWPIERAERDWLATEEAIE
jgi:putative membrane protein